MNFPDLEIVRVEGRRLEHAFLDFPRRLYKDDPVWAEPLRFLERRRWSPRHNPSLSDRQTVRFVARCHGRILGIVAGIVDPAFSCRWRRGAGFFGFFECINDKQVAGALLGKVSDWLRRNGRKSVIGPVNLTTHDEVGIMVEGFGENHTILVPHNPPYYADLLTSQGFQALRGYRAFRLETSLQVPERILRLAQRTRDRFGPALNIRQMNLSEWDREIGLLHALYRDCFDDVWGFTPIAYKDFEQRAKEFRSFARPQLVHIAELGDLPIAFSLVLPNINDALKGIGGRLNPVTIYKLSRRIKGIRSARNILLGILPHHRRSGLAAILTLHAFRAASDAGIEWGEISLVDDENTAMLRIIESYGFRKTKRVSLFEKPL